MTLARLFISIGLVLTALLTARASDSQTPPQVEAQAALDKALSAIGGIARLQRLSAVERVGVGRMSDPTQGPRPVLPAESNPPILETSTRRIAIDFRQGRAVTANQGTIVGGQPYSTRAVNGPSGGFVVNELKRTITPGGGTPAGARDPLLALPRQYPEVILLQANALRDSLAWAGTQTLGARTCALVRVGSGPAAPTLFIDLPSGELIQQQTTGNRPGATETNTIEYSDWRTESGLRLPFRHRVVRNGMRVDELELQTVAVDGAVPEAVFNRPEGFETIAVQAPAASPDVVVLAPDVYLLRRPYNSLVIVLKEFVVVLEPAVGPLVTDSTLRAVQDIAKGKPVRYVVATHFHADHIGGAKRFLESGVTLITTADAARVLGEGRETPAIEAVSRRRDIRDDTHEIQIHEIGPNPHAAEMLIVYLPHERLLFEGDLLDIDGSAAVPAIAGDDTQSFSERLTTLGLDVRTVVPVHGRVGTIDDLKRALEDRSRRLK